MEGRGLSLREMTKRKIALDSMDKEPKALSAVLGLLAIAFFLFLLVGGR